MAIIKAAIRSAATLAARAWRSCETARISSPSGESAGMVREDRDDAEIVDASAIGAVLLEREATWETFEGMELLAPSEYLPFEVGNICWKHCNDRRPTDGVMAVWLAWSR